MTPEQLESAEQIVAYGLDKLRALTNNLDGKYAEMWRRQQETAELQKELAERLEVEQRELAREDAALPDDAGH